MAQKFAYINKGTPETVEVQVLGTDVVKARTATEQQIEAGFTGQQLVMETTEGRVYLDIWDSNKAQVKGILAGLSESDKVQLVRQKQTRKDEETGVADLDAAGVPKEFVQWHLPRVLNADPAATLAKLEAL